MIKTNAFDPFVVHVKKHAVNTGEKSINVHQFSPIEAIDLAEKEQMLTGIREFWDGAERPYYVFNSLNINATIKHFRHTSFGLFNISFPVSLKTDGHMLVHAGHITRISAIEIEMKMYHTLVIRNPVSSFGSSDKLVQNVIDIIPSVKHQVRGFYTGADKVVAIYFHFESENDRVVGKLALTDCATFLMEDLMDI